VAYAVLNEIETMDKEFRTIFYDIIQHHIDTQSV